MAEIKDTVKGFTDYTGEDALKRVRIEAIIKKVFRLYGFEPAETPIVEYEEFVKSQGSENDEAISDIFRLEDKGKRKLALRYEFTFQLKRIAQNKKLPYKRYQVGPVFRDEPVSSNRFRQFTQCDVDVVGSGLKDDAEILALATRVLDDLGIKSIIYFNNRKLLNEILETEGVKEKDRAEVIREIDKLDKLSEKEVKANLKKYNAESVVSIFGKEEKYFEKYKAYEEIKELKKLCSIYGIKVEFLPSLARGLSYYNGSIFEIKTKEMKETICAGGAYLINGIQSVGISFGLERLSQLAKVDKANQDTLIISIGQDKEAIKLAEAMRNEGKSCIVMYNKISKALDFANANNIEKVVFIGEEEVKQKKVKLRDMKTGKEKLIGEKELIE